MQVTEAAGRKWALTQAALDGLLAALGSDRENAGYRYVRIRRDLVRLFQWRGCSAPDDYADETMNRCAKKIAEGQGIRDISAYMIGVARMLLREMARDRASQMRPLDEIPELYAVSENDAVDLEMRVESLRRSLARLSGEEQYLIINYYEGDKSERIRRRKMLMQTLGIPASTLRMRAMRIREKLHLTPNSQTVVGVASLGFGGSLGRNFILCK